jgi:hypothetical protein
MLINETSAIVAREGVDGRARFSSIPVLKAMRRQACWEYLGTERSHKKTLGGSMARHTGFRLDVPQYLFAFSLPKFNGMKGAA